MARSNIPEQTPLVPHETFISMNMLFNAVRGLDADLAAVEGVAARGILQLVSSAVLVDHPVLQFAMKASRRYRFQALLFCSANVKIRYTGPAAPTLVMAAREEIDVTPSVTFDTAYSAADIPLTTAAILRITGLIHNGVNAGNFKIQWAQNSSNATPSEIYIGSVLQYSLID